MQACTYDGTLGLKTEADLIIPDGSGGWDTAHPRRQQYAYESVRDYLTGANYDNGDGTWEATPTWSYDPAGNRNDATTVDNLNRATTIAGVSRTYDILGNTLTIGSSKSMTWDVLNRMASCTVGSTTTSYQYRADGMRVKKSSASNVYTEYAYDGQMPMQEWNYRQVYFQNTLIKVINYGLGARGIDRIERIPVQGSAIIGYPIYDAHGNMIETLFKSGSSYSTGDQRQYDAWGAIRTGNSSGEPNAKYCANLGHLQDDESGFVYMRARYYEPVTGRFVSEDSALRGHNWYCYANNNPTDRVDPSGKNAYEAADNLRKIMDYLRGHGVGGQDMTPSCIKILEAGIVAAMALEAFAAYAEASSAALMAAAGGAAALAEAIPWLPSLLYSVSSLARICAVGLQLASELILYQTAVEATLSALYDDGRGVSIMRYEG